MLSGHGEFSSAKRQLISSLFQGTCLSLLQSGQKVSASELGRTVERWVPFLPRPVAAAGQIYNIHPVRPSGPRVTPRLGHCRLIDLTRLGQCSFGSTIHATLQLSTDCCSSDTQVLFAFSSHSSEQPLTLPSPPFIDILALSVPSK